MAGRTSTTRKVRYKEAVAAGKDETGRSRIASAVGGLPVVGDLARQVEAQARWVQELVEQNARLVGQLPATIKTFNDGLERFNQTVSRLDRAVGRLESATAGLTGPIERIAATIDPRALRDLPDVLTSLRTETLPALRAAVDTQEQMAVLQGSIDRIVALLGELPGAGIVRRMTGPRSGGRPGATDPPGTSDATGATGATGGGDPRPRPPRARR